MSKSITLVTGATGTSGFAIVEALLAKNIPTRALVRNPDTAKHLKTLGAEIIQGDLSDPASLTAAFEGVSKLVSVLPNTLDQVEQEQALIKAAQDAKVSYVVKLSAAGAAPDASELLLRWHGEGEVMLKESGLPFTIVRPAFFMQNILGQAAVIAGQSLFALPMGDGEVAAIDVRDIGSTVASLLASNSKDHKGQTYTLTGSERLSFTDIADIVSENAKRPISYIAVSPEDFKTSLLEWGQQDWFADALNELFTNVRSNAQAVPTDAVKLITGEAPRSFWSLAQEHAASFKAAA